MAAGLARDLDREEALNSGRSRLGPLIKAAVGGYDSVLVGMVAAGLGLEAICLFLGLSGAALQHNLVRLGLEQPHGRPLRKGGRKAWSTLDVMRLIAYRVACVHPATIALKLDRSVSGVYAKLRRLGVPAPARSSLRRCNVASLPEPQLDFGFPAQETELGGSRLPPTTSNLAIPVERKPSPSPSSIERSTVSLPSSTRKAARGATRSQRELPLLRNLPAGDVSAPDSNTSASPSVPHQQTPILSPETGSPVVWAGVHVGGVPVAYMSDDELAGRLTKRFIVRDPVAIMNLTIRILGGWSYTAAAERLGTTASKLASLLNFIDLPRDSDRTKYCDTYDLECGVFTLKLSTYSLERCRQYPDRSPLQQSLFWWDKRAKGQKISRKARMKRFEFLDRERHRSQPINLIRLSELVARRSELSRLESLALQSTANQVGRSQFPLQGSLRVLQGGSNEERERGNLSPPVRPGLPGKPGKQMPWTYAGNGRPAGRVARP